MTRKSYAGFFAIAVLLAAAFAAPHFFTPPQQVAARGETAVIGGARSDRGQQIARFEQRQAEERKAALEQQKPPTGIEIPTTSQAEAQARVAAQRRQQDERGVADAMTWAERYRQQREAAAKEASKQDEAVAALFQAPIETEIDRQQREAGEALARKHRQDEERLIAEAKAKAQGVQLGQHNFGPSEAPTGTIGLCPKCTPRGVLTAMASAKAGTGVSARSTGRQATARHGGRTAAQANPGRRVPPVRTASLDCPLLQWLARGH